MNKYNIALAYCLDNVHLVEELEQNLKSPERRFEHFYGKKSTDNKTIAEQLEPHSGPILLIISDNFLKSSQCMGGGLQLLQEKGTQILPIVIPGKKLDVESGEPSQIPTNFERVSDIIQYINYWQDQYLDLRKQKRNLKDIDEEQFNAHFKLMRQISTDVGEFLRLLRSLEHIDLVTFKQNSYEAFFRFLDDQEAWNQFRQIEAASIVQKEEVIDKKKNADIPLEIAGIPGIDLLEETLPNEEDEEDTLASAAPSELENLEDIPIEIEEIEIPNNHLGNIPNAVPDTPQNIEEETHRDEIPDSNQIEEVELPIPEISDATVPPLVQKEELEEKEVLEEKEIEEGEKEEEVNTVEVLNSVTELLTGGDITGGMQLLNDAIQENPNQWELRYHYAIQLARYNQDFDSAENQLRTILTQDSENSPAYFLLGELMELKGQYDTAIANYEKALEIDPNHTDANYRLGLLLANQYEGKGKIALRYFKKAVKLNPDNADASYQYALLLHEHLGKNKKAVKYLRNTLSIQPDHPFVNYDLALVYHHLGQLKKAKKYYLKAIGINPELKTEENNLAFLGKAKASAIKHTPATVQIPEISSDSSRELEARIHQLEEQLQAQKAEIISLKEAKEEVPVPVTVKTVLISGATAGIGRATAELFAKNGHRVIINGRRAERLNELKQSFEEAYETQIQTLSFDIQNPDAVKIAIEQLEEDWRDIDILINNAGMGRGNAPIHEGEIAHWEEMINTNFKGLLYLTRAITPGMVTRRNGHIINVGSIAGRQVYTNSNVYSATKFAVEGLTRAMRLDLHQYGIRVSQVSPGLVETEFALVRYDGDEKRANIYQDFKPLTSEDVAESIYFIASQPKHVNIQDILMMSTQQANALVADRSGRAAYDEEE